MNVLQFIKYLISPKTQKHYVDAPAASKKVYNLPQHVDLYFQIAYNYLEFVDVFRHEYMSPVRALIYAFEDKYNFSSAYLSKADKMMNLAYFQKLQRLNVAVELLDIQMHQSNNTAYSCYFVVLREAVGRALVINVRGTENIGDCLTDLDIRVHNGAFHNGFYQEAVECFDHIESKSYFHDAERVVFTGYSMGGSVATVLEALARQRGINKTECYAFSPAPTVTASVNQQYLKNGCYSFIIEDDVVPACSGHAIRTAVLRAAAFLRSTDYNGSSAQLSASSAKEDDCFLGGYIYRLYKGDFYHIDEHEYGEMSVVLENCCYHASSQYFDRRVRRLIRDSE